jgi:hypothetical protein
LVVQVIYEPGGLIRSGFADGFVGHETAQGLQAKGEVIDRDEVGEMLAELIMALVVKAPDSSILDDAIHALDLSVGLRMPRLGQPVFDVEFGAGELEGVAEKRLLVGQHLLDVLGRPTITAGLDELRAVVGEHGMDPVWNGRGEGAQEVAGDLARGFLVHLGEGGLRGPIDADKKGRACPAPFAPQQY